MDAPIIDGKVVQIRSAAPPGKMRCDSIKRDSGRSGTCRAMRTAVSARAIPPQKP